MRIEYETNMELDQKHLFAKACIDEDRNKVKIVDELTGRLIESFRYELETGEEKIVLQWYIAERLSDLMR